MKRKGKKETSLSYLVIKVFDGDLKVLFNIAKSPPYRSRPEAVSSALRKMLDATVKEQNTFL